MEERHASLSPLPHFPALLPQDEVQVWSSGVNVAQGKSVSSLSVLSASYPASKAVDGVTVQNLASESFFNSAGATKAEYWEVDLGSTFTVERITIYNRWNNSCCRERVIGHSLCMMDTGRSVVGPVVNLTGGQIMNISYAAACGPSPTPSPAPTPGYCAPRYIRVQSVTNNGARSHAQAWRMPAGGMPTIMTRDSTPPRSFFSPRIFPPQTR